MDPKNTWRGSLETWRSAAANQNSLSFLIAPPAPPPNCCNVGPSGAGVPNLVRVNLINSNVVYFDPRNQVVVSTGRSGNYCFDPSAFERASLATLNTQSNAGQGAVTN